MDEFMKYTPSRSKHNIRDGIIKLDPYNNQQKTPGEAEVQLELLTELLSTDNLPRALASPSPLVSIFI